MWKENGIYKIRYTATSDKSSGLLDQPVMKSKALYNSLEDIRLQNEKGKKSGRRVYVRYIINRDSVYAEVIMYPLHRHRILWKPCMMSRHGKKTNIHFSSWTNSI